MPSGVYKRDTMGRDYHGFRRIRMEPRPGVEGTRAVVAVECEHCQVPLERTAQAVKLAKKEARGFCCAGCNGLRSRATKMAQLKMGEPGAVGATCRGNHQKDGDERL